MKISLILSLVLLSMLSGCADKKINRYNEEASLSDTLPFHPLEWKVISSFVNRDHNTMSTLYGNDTAVLYARQGLAYPVGSAIALVTWSQREDPHWHGAHIPGVLQSIEQILFTTRGGVGPEQSKIQFLYEKYEGKPLRKIVTDSSVNVNNRIAYLVSQKASVMP
ncbi:MAG: cytochrome P460 family protein [Bacteroidota bacterium]